jgi:hypothetical protein
LVVVWEQELLIQEWFAQIFSGKVELFFPKAKLS